MRPRLPIVLCLALLLPGAARSAAGPQLAAAASRQVGVTRIYDPSYVQLRYPGGDVPTERGVCADVIVRAFRGGIGIDLQRELHEDMRAHFRAYPRNWGLSAPDANIDHRRVPNLMTFFERRGKSTRQPFATGDIVAWRLPGGLYHIGIVADPPFVVHNIGRGAQREDILFAYPIIGHYRW
jgi:uncharacterized protein YijF (DUF1287 family)